MSVADILEKKGGNVFTVRPEHTIADAAALLAAKKVGVAVVCDAKGRIVGMVSERDIVQSLAGYGKGALEMPVRNIMSTQVLTCSPDDSAKYVLQVMTERRIRHLPVIDAGELVGIVSIGDAVNRRFYETQQEVGILRDFAATR